MDKISQYLQKNCSLEENVEFLQKSIVDTINSIKKTDICEIMAIIRPPNFIVELSRAIVWLFGQEYNSWDDFRRFLSDPYTFISKIKEKDPKIPIEECLLDKLFIIIYLQDIKIERLWGIFSHLFIWIKAYLAIQIIIRGLDF